MLYMVGVVGSCRIWEVTDTMWLSGQTRYLSSGLVWCLISVADETNIWSCWWADNICNMPIWQWLTVILYNVTGSHCLPSPAIRYYTCYIGRVRSLVKDWVFWGASVTDWMVLRLRPPGLGFRILCLEGSVISFITRTFLQTRDNYPMLIW